MGLCVSRPDEELNNGIDQKSLNQEHIQLVHACKSLQNRLTQLSTAEFPKLPVVMDREATARARLKSIVVQGIDMLLAENKHIRREGGSPQRQDLDKVLRSFVMKLWESKDELEPVEEMYYKVITVLERDSVFRREGSVRQNHLNDTARVERILKDMSALRQKLDDDQEHIDAVNQLKQFQENVGKLADTFGRVIHMHPAAAAAKLTSPTSAAFRMSYMETK